MMWLTEDVECVGDYGVRTFVADVISKYGVQTPARACMRVCSSLFVSVSVLKVCSHCSSVLGQPW